MAVDHFDRVHRVAGDSEMPEVRILAATNGGIYRTTISKADPSVKRSWHQVIKNAHLAKFS